MWARDNGDGTHHGVTVTQDALYAMRYDSDGLAQGVAFAFGGEGEGEGEGEKRGWL